MHKDDIRALVRGDQSRPHLVTAFARRHGIAPFITRSARPGGRWGHTATWDEDRQAFNESLLFKGVVETPEEAWFEHYSAFDLVAVPCPRPDLGLAYARRHAQQRTGYDYSGAASVAFREDWQDNGRLYCSEKETRILMAAGLALFADPERGIHPHDLWRVVAAFALKWQHGEHGLLVTA